MSIVIPASPNSFGFKINIVEVEGGHRNPGFKPSTSSQPFQTYQY